MEIEQTIVMNHLPESFGFRLKKSDSTAAVTKSVQPVSCKTLGSSLILIFFWGHPKGLLTSENKQHCFSLQSPDYNCKDHDEWADPVNWGLFVCLP